MKEEVFIEFTAADCYELLKTICESRYPHLAVSESASIDDDTSIVRFRMSEPIASVITDAQVESPEGAPSTTETDTEQS